MGVENLKSVDQKTYEAWVVERRKLQDWETFIVDFVSGARRLQDREAHTAQPVFLVDVPSKVATIEAAQLEDLTAFWRDVRKEVSKLTKLSLVNQWFGIPVRESAWGMDPNNWARYSSKVPNPMDLRTIAEKLSDSGMPRAYTSPDQVTADIRRIVSNCESFNEGDAGDQVCKVARQLQNTWERRWQPDDGTGLQQRWEHLTTRHRAETKALKWLQAASGDQTQARLQAFDAKVQKLLEEEPPPPVATIPWELRRKVGVRIAQLNDSNVAHVMQILDHLQPRAIRAAARPDGDTVLDMNNLTLESLEKLQLFLDHLPVRKGKEDKKKKSAVKGKDGKFRSATAAPASAAGASSPLLAPASAPASGPNSAATTPNHPATPNTADFGLSQSCLGLGDDGGVDHSGSEGPDLLMHDISMHERPFDDPMHDAIDVT